MEFTVKITEMREMAVTIEAETGSEALKQAKAAYNVYEKISGTAKADRIDFTLTGTPEDEEGICPLCGASVEYAGDRHCDEAGTITSWCCPACGASGEEAMTDHFDRHYRVTDKDGKHIPGRPE